MMETYYSIGSCGWMSVCKCRRVRGNGWFLEKIGANQEQLLNERDEHESSLCVWVGG